MRAPGGVGFQSAELDDILERARGASDGYAARVVASELLSVGLYTLAAGAVDDQTPHLEDEVYYVVRGRAQFAVDGLDRPVRAGSLLYVPARVEHRFHDIDEELVLIVFWAPPEETLDPVQEVAR